MREQEIVEKIGTKETPITPETAKLLERALGPSADFWLRLDENYRKELAMDDGSNEIRPIPPSETIEEMLENNKEDSSRILKLTTWERLRDEMSRLANTWEFTVDTSDTRGYTELPLELGTPTETVKVDWGDGHFGSLDKNSGESEAKYKYSRGQYRHKIRLYCHDWSKIYLKRCGKTYFEVLNDGLRDGDGFQRTLVSVDTPVPHVKGVWYKENINGRTTSYECGGSLSGLFKFCAKLETVCDDAFSRNKEVQDFSEIFFGCRSMRHISEDIFANNANAVTFRDAFRGCRSLRNVPNFAGNPKAMVFARAFTNCAALKTVPENMFRAQLSNGLPLTLDYVFAGCVKLHNAPLLMSGNKKSTVRRAFADCESVERIPARMLKDQKIMDQAFDLDVRARLEWGR